MRFLDTNVIIRYLTGDEPVQSPLALALLERVEQGEETVVVSPMVVFEIVFTLQSFYCLPRPDIRSHVLNVVRLGGVRLPNKSVYERALDLYVAHNLSFADAFNVAYAAARSIPEMYSWDRGLDRLQDVTRAEPTADSTS